MNISAMNTQILFQKNTLFVDDTGNHINKWADLYTCYATISDSGGKNSTEISVAGMTIDNADICFTIRYCKTTAVITNTDYRIIWNDNIYNIVKVDHLNLKKHAIKFRCEKVRK